MPKRALDQAMEIGGVIIIDNALMTWTWGEPGEVWTGAIWVHPDHRRQGLYCQMERMLIATPGVEWLCAVTRAKRQDVTAAFQKMGRTIIDRKHGMLYWRDRVCEGVLVSE